MRAFSWPFSYWSLPSSRPLDRCHLRRKTRGRCATRSPPSLHWRIAARPGPSGTPSGTSGRWSPASSSPSLRLLGAEGAASPRSGSGSAAHLLGVPSVVSSGYCCSSWCHLITLYWRHLDSTFTRSASRAESRRSRPWRLPCLGNHLLSSLSLNSSTDLQWGLPLQLPMPSSPSCSPRFDCCSVAGWSWLRRAF